MGGGRALNTFGHSENQLRTDGAQQDRGLEAQSSSQWFIQTFTLCVFLRSFLYADLLLNFESLRPSGRTVKAQTWSTLDVPGYGGELLVRRDGRRTLKIDVYCAAR
jgi:hypothetical protein